MFWNSCDISRKARSRDIDDDITSTASPLTPPFLSHPTTSSYFNLKLMAPKRKSDAAVTIAAKKARLDGDLAAGRKLVEDVLSAATRKQPPSS
jgi:hypothetical protein